VSLSPTEAKALYEGELERIERIVVFTARRNGLSADELDEFRSETHLHLIDHDHRAVAAFDGRSSFGTYLLVVIQRFLLDFRTARWGRWRPSATARRAGATAVRLETLVVRDGRDFAEAVEILQRNHGVTTSRDDLYDLLQSFPQRHGKASVRVSSLDAENAPEVPQPAPVEPSVTLGESTGDGASDSAGDSAGDGSPISPEGLLSAVLESELSDLDPEDRLLLRLIYRDGHTVSTVARRLGFEQRPLYHRMDKLRGRLRRALEKRGVTWDDLAPLLGSGSPGPGLDVNEIFAPRPSDEAGGRTEPMSRGAR